jgi:hypothetical protein
MKALLTRQNDDNTTSAVTRLQNHLLDFLNSDRASQGTKYRMQDLIFSEKQYYIRFDITGAGLGKTKILDETTKKAVGVTNFNLGQLPKFTNFAWNRIAIKYADDATGAGVAIKDVKGYTSVRGSVDKSVANGELLINKNGSPIFENPISPYLHDAAPVSGSTADMSFEIDQIVTLRENELVTIELNQSAANPATAAHTFGIEVVLIGLEVRLGAS